MDDKVCDVGMLIVLVESFGWLGIFCLRYSSPRENEVGLEGFVGVRVRMTPNK